jgi:hypothetical protein
MCVLGLKSSSNFLGPPIKFQPLKTLSLPMRKYRKNYERDRIFLFDTLVFLVYIPGIFPVHPTIFKLCRVRH